MRQEGEHANIRSIIYVDQRHEWRPRLAVENPVKLAALSDTHHRHTRPIHQRDQAGSEWEPADRTSTSLSSLKTKSYTCRDPHIGADVLKWQAGQQKHLFTLGW